MENIGANQNQRAADRRQLNIGLFADRRIGCDKSGSAFTTPDTYAYLYNARSEQTNATALVDSACRYCYNFDDIGNRVSSSERGMNFTYKVNNLNQGFAGSDEPRKKQFRERFFRRMYPLRRPWPGNRQSRYIGQYNHDGV